MRGTDDVGACEVGHRARDAQQTVVSAGGQTQAVEGSREHVLTGGINRTAVGHVGGRNVGVDTDAQITQTVALPLACGQHSGADGG